MTITVYSRHSCGPCYTLKHWLKSKGINYQELSLDDNPALADEVIKKSGIMMLPMIEVGSEVVSGLNLGRLSSLLAEIRV